MDDDEKRFTNALSGIISRTNFLAWDTEALADQTELHWREKLDNAREHIGKAHALMSEVYKEARNG
jgi:hypothetical protein